MFGSPLSVIIYALAVSLATGLATPTTTTLGLRSLEQNGGEKSPWKVHDVQCHNEADFPGHADINPTWQGEAVRSFCDSDQASRTFTTYQDPADNHYPVVFKLRFRWKDMWKVNYDFYVQWVPGCRTSFGAQTVQNPLFSSEGNPTCVSMMEGNFKKCNNGGVGGSTQVGCLLYTFSGGRGGNLLTAVELKERRIYDEEHGITRKPDP
ncbi:hypothetical protein CORC01_07417 [Colletotrichum orchidophilum]|uniref:Uncharacterized protein n=1 Tax=Colletotrichum orchidophilum TaxID=1209926 RepID=A0A1G4B7W0_9PEZI|nr:uncharacterized protein CORC01_07417 [Colletotrichum orchidophilum]OHE97362.1 hypothetical protein CORC01_07417 [Colletotrichum orchidophilum]